MKRIIIHNLEMDQNKEDNINNRFKPKEVWKTKKMLVKLDVMIRTKLL